MKLWQRLQHNFGTGLIKSATLLALAGTAAPVSAQNFLVEYADDKLSVQANNIRVKELLLEIQEKTGIPVNFIADPKDTVSIDVSEQTVESVIAKITENHMIIHDTINGKKNISELIIISDDPELNNTGGSANLPSGQPAPAITSEPDGTSSENADDNIPNSPQPPTPTDASPSAPSTN